MSKKLKNAPGWLGLTDDRTAFIRLPDRAEIVQRIFKLSIAGLGGYTIAKLLNAEGVPAFGSSKRWDQSTIHNMLSSKATIGEYQRKQILEGKEVSIGEPIPSYYPPVIEKHIFEAAQAARRENLSKRRGRKGKQITNLFAEIPKCSYCGNKIKLHNAPVKSIVCKKVWDGDNCFKYRWSYQDFEQTLLKILRENDESDALKSHLEQLDAHISQDDKGGIYQTRLAIAQHIRSTVVNLTVAFGGAAPQQQEMHRFIRDHPNRHFTVELSNGTSHIGRPVTRERPEPDFKFDSKGLCELLGLSPRQGRLTALLAEGQTLTSAAEEMGMTLSTARWHLREIFRKTNSHSQGELINLARAASPPEPSKDRASGP